MELLRIGLSYRTAPVEVRERLVLAEAAQAELLRQLGPAPAEALLLSTCNRVELYLVSPEGGRSLEQAREALGRLGGPEALAHLEASTGEAARLHLFRVAASLDSMVLGEAQILGQLKEAFERGRRAGTVRGELTREVSAALACAKRVRTETAIGRAATSVASAAVALAGRALGGLAQRTVLLVGAGELATLVARHLKQAGVGRLTITNRTAARAEALAAEVGAEARPFGSLRALLAEVELVVSASSSPEPVLAEEDVRAAGEARGHRPLVLVDLAVPRDVAPEVRRLGWTRLYDVDDVRRSLDEGTAARVGEARKAEALVAGEVARFAREQAVREHVPVLARLRQRAEAIARAEVERTLAALGDELTERQRKSIEAMGRAIVNKLLHAPTARLRSTAPGPGGGRLAEATAELFGLEAGPALEPAQGERSAAPAPAAPLRTPGAEWARCPAQGSPEWRRAL